MKKYKVSVEMEIHADDEIDAKLHFFNILSKQTAQHTDIKVQELKK